MLPILADYVLVNVFCNRRTEQMNTRDTRGRCNINIQAPLHTTEQNPAAERVAPVVCLPAVDSEVVMLSSHKGSPRWEEHTQARSPFWAQRLYAHQLTGLPAWDTLQKARGTSKRMTLVTSARIMRWFKNWRENGYTFELIKYTGEKYLVGISLVGQGIWWFYSTSLQHPEAIWQNFQIQGWGHFNHWQVLCWKMEKQNTKPKSEPNYPLSRLS